MHNTVDSHAWKISEHEIVLQECKSKQKQFHVHNSYKTVNKCSIALEKLKKIWLCLTLI